MDICCICREEDDINKLVKPYNCNCSIIMHYDCLEQLPIKNICLVCYRNNNFNVNEKNSCATIIHLICYTFILVFYLFVFINYS